MPSGSELLKTLFLLSLLLIPRIFPSWKLGLCCPLTESPSGISVAATLKKVTEWLGKEIKIETMPFKNDNTL